MQPFAVASQHPAEAARRLISPGPPDYGAGDHIDWVARVEPQPADVLHGPDVSGPSCATDLPVNIVTGISICLAR
jgi:hypothetical protein